MKIPKKVRVLGHWYKVEIQKEDASGNDNLGTHWGKFLKMWLSSNQCKEKMEETFLHEIIEAVNYHLDLDLKHPQISGLSQSFHQIFKDNKLF